MTNEQLIKRILDEAERLADLSMADLKYEMRNDPSDSMSKAASDWKGWTRGQLITESLRKIVQANRLEANRNLDYKETN